MKTYKEVVESLLAPCPSVCVQTLKEKIYKENRRNLVVRKGIKPVDLYCYFYGRFGQPNGIQSILRTDDSDNLFHWHYTFALGDDVLIDVMAATYKIEIFYPEVFCFDEDPLTGFISAIQNDFKNHGEKIKAARARLEKWLHFINPFKKMKATLERMRERGFEIEALTKTPIQHPVSNEEFQEFQRDYSKTATLLDELYGISLTIRMMAPVMAESFINLLMFTLARPEVSADARLFDSLKRQPIDVRVKTIHMNCHGFVKQVDINSNRYKGFHTLMNGRNDHLHGNISPEQTFHEELFFDGTIPLFSDWRGFHERCFNGHERTHSFEKACQDMKLVDDFIEEVLAATQDKFRPSLVAMLDKMELGYRPEKKRLGILFPDHLVDFSLSPGPPQPANNKEVA